MTPKYHERIALYPGTFDPFTIGHLSIINRGLELFDRIIVAVGINDSKRCYRPTSERVEHIKGVMADEPRVEVTSYDGLTVDVAARHGAQFILRGVRTVADYEYERNLAYANRRISGIETVLLYTLPELQYVSSTMVRDLDRCGYDISQFVPKAPDCEHSDTDIH
ncbi:pantetheine-phosphate adenylyltransferase [Muribaculum intestinale]|jgi:pantetheine-phosphate adenylyltransferase|uniref:Phosphopantetheine adenylyltransferase n=2 Tax=Muribaculum intestinale TaxID=1796646 RepID=A0A1B1S895_9BACT|nr:pantetheine-phosphate adenylyltransferase [Muribaculum intestinale]ROS82125.1 pantetheine-phosphate adenylyltransferase [Muribaculaceae bacterium Isolate-042 (Harlan)]ROT07201.1 pantetheine-phosphate adenylyltransferase [Muribaculaceae bacterium Isolate-100 (HZI)]RXE65213.1 pantetheine-phosphate adenylyltransferase [Muribaculaceae bacterium Isolate-007 (NCI)]ANU63007.1 pantetheine-phosphate adenylyltransferase [Muribaculum intestinale]ASB38922.1 pantetheine-phosphate adenylyltransferase [Mu